MTASILRLALFAFLLSSSVSVGATKGSGETRQLTKNADDVSAERKLDTAWTKKPTPAPVRPPTRAPVRPTRSPVRPTRAPVRPTRSPVRPTRAPVRPTRSPVRPTRSPVRPTRSPVRPTRAPVRPPTKAPVRTPTNAPVQPTKAPVRAPTKPPTRRPTKPTKAPTRRPTRKPTKRPTRIPTRKPTRRPTRLPTARPTKRPTPPTLPPTPAPTFTKPPECGSLLTSDGENMLLGPYDGKIEPSSFNCNTGSGSWFAHSYYAPSYMYAFQLTQKCEYQFRTPEGNLQWEEVSDVNSWFEQAATTFQRIDNVGYRVSDDDIIFNGLSVPNYQSDLIAYDKISDCPENYCVKVKGPAVGWKTQVGVGSPELLYAFSHKSAYDDFYKMLRDTMRSSNKDHIYLTNHFRRCGCEAFCMDDQEPDDTVAYGATCYTENVCGTRVFQIAYAEDYPEDEKADWASTGTIKVMDWFNECASAMYGCTEHPKSDSSMFKGTGDSSGDKPYPKVFTYNSWGGASNVYGLGGVGNDGFPDSKSSSSPIIAWTCPTPQHRAELDYFGQFVEKAEFMRDAGLETPLPTTPCEPDIINPPEPPVTPPPIGPRCEDVNHIGYCNQMPGATCYIAEASVTCAEVDFVLVNETSTLYFDDVADWTDACIASGVNCEKEQSFASFQGKLLYNGAPNAYALFVDGEGWMYLAGNRLNSGKSTLDGFMYYSCESWEGSFGAKNFTEGAGDRFDVFGNSYGDLFAIDAGKECTASPTLAPSHSPSLSFEPSNAPTQAPTLCGESYLTSENLNIALVVDLSFSTYEKEFSSSVKIGDVNGDGKPNTILDAQVVAIQDLLTSIAESPTLNNDNCEIELISFETDAKDHGKWSPLDDSGNSYNSELMNYIKNKLRAPVSNDDVFNTNNGFTNFDDALDVTVEYFQKSAAPNRKNLLVFLSDGEPNVRGDGDKEGYCTETTVFWNGDNTILQCSDLGLEPGERHTICRGNDPNCVEFEPLQDCVRGPTECMNADAVTQYDSEISALDELKVERLAIGVGDESNIASGSALWMIDNNPAKDLGVLPLQALNLEELTVYLSSLCILNTDPPTGSPTASPTASPTESPAPSMAPTDAPSESPTPAPSTAPTELPYFVMLTPEPTLAPSSSPTNTPTPIPTSTPSTSPTTSEPTISPSAPPSKTPTLAPTDSPTTTPSAAPSGSFYPSLYPTASPTRSPAPSNTPTVSPSGLPTGEPTGSPSGSPTDLPTTSPTDEPTEAPSVPPTSDPTASFEPTFVLPECYEGPKMVVKDSSDITMCYYNQDMVQINEMNSNDVTVAINNVWTRDALPEQLRVFVHTSSIDAILDKEDGDGFQCLNTDGTDIDIEGDNELSVQCFQESEGAPWLAIIDVVIADEIICATNDVPHPCFPESEPIPESCSWRIVIPCEQEALCTEEPTSSPSNFPTSDPSSSPSLPPSFNPTTGSPVISPTANPTTSPTVSEYPSLGETSLYPSIGDTSRYPLSEYPSLGETSLYPSLEGTSRYPLSEYPSLGETSLYPSLEGTSRYPPKPTKVEEVDTASPTESPSAKVTHAPTAKFTQLGPPSDGDDVIFPPAGPPECPEDIQVISHTGVTNLPDHAVRIVDQNSSTVTVQLVQAYTDASAVIGSWYYQYQQSNFSNKCYGDNDIAGEDIKEITIKCFHHNQVALLEFWVSDDINNGVLVEGDNAVIPECCHSTEPEGTPVTKYVLQIRCETMCPEVVA